MNNTFYTNIQVSGDHILHRGYENGRRVNKKVKFQPTVYIEKNTNSDFKTIDGKNVEPFNPGGIKDCKEFIENYNQVDNFTIHGHTDWIYPYISSLYPNNEDANYDINLIKVLYIDIENECENGFCSASDASEKINVVTLKHKEKKYVFALNEFALPEDKNIKQIVFYSEEDLLETLIETIKEIDPDVITGWNVRFYDIPYILNRIIKVFGEKNGVNLAKQISPWNKIHEQEIKYKGSVHKVYKIYGIDVLDYYELYRKYILAPRENYKLDYIVNVELGKRKVNYSEYPHIKDFYTKNFQKFVEYNVVDVELVEELDKKLNLLELHISMAYLAKTNYNDIFSQVKMWDTIIYNHLLKKKIVLSPKKSNEKEVQYSGAYVKEPIVGFHDWVVSYDIASLYPHLILQYNISPDTIVENPEYKFKNYTIEDFLNKDIETEELKKYNYSMAANCQLFKNEKMGFLPELMQQFYNQRKTYKKLATENKKLLEKETDKEKSKIYSLNIAKYDTMQMAYKIALNSAYGSVGNQYFRHYDIRQAEAITKSGQLSIRWIQNKLNQFLNKIFKTSNVDYIIASDTDSVYLNLKNAVEKFDNKNNKTLTIDFLDKFCKQIIDPFIEKSYKELAVKMNAFSQKMEMKREVIADRGLWKAKKMYCLNVYDSEGVRYTEPNLKIMGIEVQRSSTPNICRTHLKECVKIILTKTENDLIEYIDNVKKEFMNASIEEIAFPRGVNNLEKYDTTNSEYKKGTPMHVKGSLAYNRILKKHKIDKFYSAIKNGDKIKYVHLKEPNPIGCKIICFIGNIPQELNLNLYVDKETQFQKAFLDPLESLLKAVKWHHESKNSLEGFFQ